MLTITCDVCKKTIPEAMKDVNFFTIREKYICKTCKKDFEREIEDMLEDEVPNYTLKLYQDTYWEELEQATE